MPKASVSTLEVEVYSSAEEALFALDKLEDKLNKVGTALDRIVTAAKGIKDIGNLAQSFKGISSALSAVDKAQKATAKHKNDGKVSNQDLIDRKRLLDDISKMSASKLLGFGNRGVFSNVSGKQLPALNNMPTYRDLTKMLPAVYGGKQLPALFAGQIVDPDAIETQFRQAFASISFADLMKGDKKSPYDSMFSDVAEQAKQLPAVIEVVDERVRDIEKSVELARTRADAVDAEFKEVTSSIEGATAAAEAFNSKTRSASLFGTRTRSQARGKAADVLGEKYWNNIPKTSPVLEHFQADPNLRQFVETINGELGRTEKTGVKASIALKELQKAQEGAAKSSEEQAQGQKDAGTTAEKASSSVKQLGNETKNAASKARTSSSDFKKIGAVLSKVGQFLGIGGKGHTSKLFGRRGFGGFLSLMVIRRALTSLIRALTGGIKEGSDNLAQYSAEYNNSISRMVSGLNYLKNAWAAAFAPIVNVVAPYVETFINLLASALNAIGRFMAALTGKGFAVQAKSVWTDYAASLDKAGSSAGGAGSKMDDLKKTIMSFDEIHALNDPNSSSGGGGGGSGSGGVNPSDMFETVDLAGDSLADFASQLREKILAGDWYGVGEAIAQKLNEQIDRLFHSDWAKKLAEWFNHVIDVFCGFVENFDWTGFGKALGKSLNDFFLNIRWERLAAGIADALNGLLKAFIGFATTVKWYEIGKKIVEAIGAFFERLDWQTIGQALRVAFQSLIEFCNGVLDAVHVDEIALYAARAIINGLVGFFSGDNPELLAALTKCVKNLILTAWQVTTPWLALLNGWLKDTFGIDILGGINKKFDEWIEEAFPEAQDKVHGGAGGVLDDLDKQVNKEYGKTSDAAVKKTGQTVDESKKKWNPFAGWFKTNVNSPISGHASNLNTNITTAFATAAANATSKFSGISSWFDTNVKVPISSVFSSLGSSISNAFASAKTNLTSGWGNVSGWFETHVSVPIRNLFGTFKSIGSTAAENLRAGLKSITNMPNFHFSWNTEKKIVSLFGHQITASVPWPKISFYARGGFPDADLFAANERGNPEMVGRIGTRTAVANNNQITEALKNAMIEGLMQYGMAMSANDNGQPYQINLVVKTMNDEVLARAVERGNARRNARMYPAGAVR